jgi:hypothetical protein
MLRYLFSLLVKLSQNNDLTDSASKSTGDCLRVQPKMWGRVVITGRKETSEWFNNSILKNEFYKAWFGARVRSVEIGFSMGRVRQCLYKTSFLCYFFKFAPKTKDQRPLLLLVPLFYSFAASRASLDRIIEKLKKMLEVPPI